MRSLFFKEQVRLCRIFIHTDLFSASCVVLVPVSSGILNGTAQVDFKHCASNSFAFLRLLNPDQSNFEDAPLSMPGRPC